MLTEHQSAGKTVWVDLYNPTDIDIGEACTVYGLEIPPRAEMEEIEFSSRLQYEDGVFTISVPVTPPNNNGGEDVTTPLGFVLTKDMLVTIRFAGFTLSTPAALPTSSWSSSKRWWTITPTGWRSCAPRR